METARYLSVLLAFAKMLRCAVQVLHAQSKPPAFVVAEIAVRDQKGYEENFLKPTLKDIADHGGKFLAGGFDKTLSILGNPPPNRVVILEFANMDTVKKWQEEGAMDMENTVGAKYASFRIFAVEARPTEHPAAVAVD